MNRIHVSFVEINKTKYTIIKQESDKCALYKRCLGGFFYWRVSEVFTGVDCWFKAIDLFHQKNNS
jgi:hypothetical protein